jgi:hypothetical protein
LIIGETIGRYRKVKSLGLDAECNAVAEVRMFPCFMVDFSNLHLLAPVEGKAGAGALQAKVGDRAGVEFAGLL